MQKVRQRSQQPRAGGVGRILRFFEDAGRHNHVGIYGPIRNCNPLGETLPPSLGNADRIFVPYQHGRVRLLQEGFEGIPRRPAQHEPDAPLGQIVFDVGEPLLHEAVVAQIRVRVVVYYGEEDRQWQAERIRHGNGCIERRVIECALRPLHPVNNAFAGFCGSLRSPHANARIFCQRGQSLGKSLVSYMHAIAEGPVLLYRLRKNAPKQRARRKEMYNPKQSNPLNRR